MRKLLIVLLVLAMPVHAQTPLDADSLGMSVDVSNEIEISPRSSNYYVDYVNAKLSWVPRESYRQEVLEIHTQPEAQSVGDELDFRWNAPRQNKLFINVNANIRTRADYFRINREVDFPIQDLGPEFSQYLQEQEIIDMDDSIRKQASTLAEGEDDLYEVVFKIASWVNGNIEYSLDTLTAEASQKSSWVLANRRGVCDELTSLFISMLRSLGIPARFVYGQAYTNIGVYDDNWGGHGWAEVYFPGHGWVPFDPTYGEYGYLDAGHAKMGESVDARRPSLKFSIRSRDADIRSGLLDIDSSVISYGGDMDPDVHLEAQVYYGNVGFGSYNLITATVRNDDDYYKPVVLRVAAPQEVTIEDNSPRYVLLAPGDQKKAYWIVSAGQLRDQYIYTLPVKVVTDRNAEVEVEFKAQSSGTSYEEDVFEDIVRGEIEQEGKPYSEQVELECVPEQEDVYAGAEVDVNCEFANEGGRGLSIQLCFDTCQALNVGPGESVQASFTTTAESIGVKNIIVTARSPEVSKTSYSKINVIDESDLRMTVDAPATAPYIGRINIMWELQKDSQSTPRNVLVKLKFQDSQQEWEFESIDKPQKFDVAINTNGFTFTNDILIEVTYEDDVGKKYRKEAEITVKMEDLSVIQWVAVALNTLGYKIISLFS